VGTAAANVSAASPRRRRRVLGFCFRHPWLVGAGLLLLVTLSVRLWWGWHFSRLLEMQNAALRARGEAADPEEVVFPPVSAEQNAWPLIARAMQADDKSAPSNQYNSVPEYPPYPIYWIRAAEASEQNNAVVFQCVRDARRLPQSQARTSFAQLSAGYTWLDGARTVARTLSDGATYQQLFVQDDREAIERIRGMLRVSRAVAEERALADQSIAFDISDMAAIAALRLGPGLSQWDSATRESVRQLIVEFLDDQATQRTFPRALRMQAQLGAQEIRDASQGTWAIQPLASRAIVSGRNDLRGYADIAATKDVQTANPYLARAVKRAYDEQSASIPFVGGDQSAPRYSRWFACVFASSRIIERQFSYWMQSLGERRIAAVSLAIQLFRADHAGAFPPQLQDLVPRYLAELPKDPFFGDERTIRYFVLPRGLPDGKDRWLVGYGLTPEPGMIDTEPMYSPYCWNGYRYAPIYYRDVMRWSPKDRRFDVELREKVWEILQPEMDIASKYAHNMFPWLVGQAQEE
jgi:hypothetical protein